VDAGGRDPRAGTPHHPVPWADGPDESFVVPAAELRAELEAAGSRRSSGTTSTAR